MDLTLSHTHRAERERIRRDRSRHPLNAARGIVIGGVVSAGLWTAIAMAVASVL